MTTSKQSVAQSSQPHSEARQRARLRRKARSLAEAGRVSEALHCQRALASLAPNDPETFMQLGFLHRAVSEIDDAASAFRRASGLAPHTPDPHEAMAEMYLDAARYDEAIHESKVLLRLTPHSIAARDIMSTAYFQKGEIGRALEVTGEMVRLAPSDALSHYKRGVLHQQRSDWRNALIEFSRAAEMSADSSVERMEAEAAIEALDQFQVRQIMTLASEDMLFRMQLGRDAEEAANERGYFLSPAASEFISQVALSGAAEHNAAPRSYVVPTKPQLYN